MNRRLKDSKSTLQVPLSMIEAAQLSSFFTKKKIALTEASTSTSFDHCDGRVTNSDKIIKSPYKSLLFFLLNLLADPLGLKVLKL